MRTSKQQEATLSAIRFGASTYDALAAKLQIPYSSATGRVRRLVKAGKVMFETQSKPGFAQSFCCVAT